MKSSKNTQTVVYASPKGVADTIAASYGERPKKIAVKMVASEAIAQFVSEIENARQRNFTVSFALD